MRVRFATRCLSGARMPAFVCARRIRPGQPRLHHRNHHGSSGRCAPNASIDVKNTDTGEVFHGGTSSTGNYVIPVPVGKYELTVTASGFKKYVRANLEVVTAPILALDVTLELGRDHRHDHGDR